MEGLHTFFSSLWIYTPLEFSLAMAIIFAGSFVRGYAGFGSGLVMVPLLALLWGPVEALATMVGISTIHSLQMTPPALPLANIRMVAPMMIVAAIATPLGTALHVSLDPQLVKKIIAGLVLIVTLVTLRGWVYRGRRGLFPSSVAGGITGIINGLAGVGGPATVLYLIAMPGDARTHRANIVLAMAFTTATVFVAMLFAGVITQRIMIHIAIFTLPSIFIVWLGAWIFSKLPGEVFRLVVLWFLIAISLAILIS